jgi:hypothetical protein
MKFTQLLLVKSLVLVLLIANSVLADDWFDSYPRIKWIDETVRLRLLANYLGEHPGEIAYISCHWTNKGDRTDMERRLRRARKYLVQTLRISSDRVVIIVGGHRNFSKTIIQPKKLGLPPPEFK